MVKVVLAQVQFDHPVRERAHPKPSLKTKKRLRKRVDDPGGRGVQTVTEVAVCPAYAAVLTVPS